MLPRNLPNYKILDAVDASVSDVYINDNISMGSNGSQLTERHRAKLFREDGERLRDSEVAEKDEGGGDDVSEANGQKPCHNRRKKPAGLCFRKQFQVVEKNKPLS